VSNISKLKFNSINQSPIAALNSVELERRNLLIQATYLAVTTPVLALAACGGSESTDVATVTTNGSCNAITPAVPQGPYYVPALNRTDIAEGRAGIPVVYRFKVQDSNCQPIAAAIVDIWQCDKDGVYSAFSSQNTSGETWLRGYFATGSEGMVSFNSIFPGWYDGRLTHLHAKVHVGGIVRQTTNVFYPKAIETAAYTNALYSKGQNPTTVARDVELRGDIARFNTLMMAGQAGGAGYVFDYIFTVV
jgi:protocatechuate 3,4-dioxygenase beta subunit